MTVNNARVANQNSALNDIFELAYVAGPVITREHIDSGCRNALDAFTVFPLKLLDKMLSEQKNIRLALAQWRHEDRKYVQPVVKILAKLRSLNCFFELLVRSHD